MHGSSDARALHAAHPAIDLHADTLMWTRWLGYELGTRHDAPLPRAAFFGHVDVPRLIEGGVGAQFFGLVSLPVSHRGNARVIDEQIDLLDAEIARPNSLLRKAMSAEDVDLARRDGVTAALLGIEGAHALEGNLDRIEHFARRGVRYLGLLHFSANEAGYPAYGRGKRESEGLSRWGRELVERCEAASVIVDLAHINRRGFMDAVELATLPPMVSHTGVLGVHAHWRNIDDEQIRAVANKGGCVGIIFARKFLGSASIDAVVDHLLHVIDVAGEDVPALGSDFDGFVVPPIGLEDIAAMPNLTVALSRRGVSDRTLEKILGGNVLRVLDAVPSWGKLAA
jgi:membrane dipeptidase